MDVWKADSGEGFCSFTVSFLNGVWKFKKHTLASSHLNCRHTGRELADVFPSTMSWYKIEGKVGFITTDGTSAAKCQVKLTKEKENILIDIHPDPSQEQDVTDDDVDFDEVFCQLELGHNLSDTTIQSSILSVNGDASVIDVSEDLSLSREAKILPDLDTLTRMLYAPKENSLNNVNIQFLHSLRATCNKMIFTAHRLQQSVRSISENSEISSMLTKIRKNVRFIRKSSIALIHMKKALAASSDFKQPYRPLLYVKKDGVQHWQWKSDIIKLSRLSKTGTSP